MLLFNWHAVNCGLFFLCMCVCVRVRVRARVYIYIHVHEIKLVKYAHVIKQKDKDIDQYKNCSTVHALHLTSISSIPTGKSTE